MSDDLLDYIQPLRAYARALCRNSTEADDLMQETLMRAINKAHQYHPGTSMKAWLFTIMRNRFYTNCRVAARERTGAVDCVSSTLSSPPTQEWHLKAQEMRRALCQLPAHYREAIVLVGMIGESYTDTAKILGIDIGTVKSRVSRARGMLRDLLDPLDEDTKSAEDTCTATGFRAPVPCSAPGRRKPMLHAGAC